MDDLYIMLKVSLPLRLQLALAIVVAASASVGVFVLSVWEASATEARHEFDLMLNRRAIGGKLAAMLELERKEGVFERVLHGLGDEAIRASGVMEFGELRQLVDGVDSGRNLEEVVLVREDGEMWVLRGGEEAEGLGEFVRQGVTHRGSSGWQVMHPKARHGGPVAGVEVVRREAIEIAGERATVFAKARFEIEQSMMEKLGHGSITAILDSKGQVVWRAGSGPQGLTRSRDWEIQPRAVLGESFVFGGEKWSARVCVVPEYGWKVVALSETETALATATGAKQLMALSAVMVLGAGLLGMLLATRMIQSPLTKLTQAALAISKGDWSKPLPDEGPTEIRQLSRAFGSMLEQLRKIYQDIERRVMDRTEELTQSHQALEEARAKAEAAAGAKEQFLANMSHEIRTPMTALLGYMEVLCDQKSGEKELDAARQTMRRSGEHILGLINDILDITKLEGDQVQATVTAVSPLEVVRHVAEHFRPQVESKGLRLVLEAGSWLPAMIESDPVLLQQVIGRLLHNAVKFTAEGEIGLRVELSDDDPAELRVAVRDTGAGIEAAQMARLFEPFVQADESMTRTHGGLGVGLAIAQRLTRVLGGRIEVDSKLGAGTVFTVVLGVGERSLLTLMDGQRALQELDRKHEAQNQLQIRQAAAESLNSAPDKKDACRVQQAQEAASTVSVQASIGQPSPALPLAGSRILMVDDCPDNRRLISLFCRKAGAEIALCNDGQAGYDAAIEATNLGIPFDMILMDMQMPVMDGYEATMRLRAKGYRLPIVAFTAHAMAGDRERCLGVGCSDYLTKPVTAKALVERCVKWVAKGREVQHELQKKRAA